MDGPRLNPTQIKIQKVVFRTSAVSGAIYTAKENEFCLLCVLVLFYASVKCILILTHKVVSWKMEFAYSFMIF